MIPKKIHYCWFSGNKMPKEFEAYIASWKKNCPDYEIIRWDETNYDVSRNTYMKDAYKEKRWGFVPDYARFDIIYQEGGIYLDTDVELVKSFGMDDYEFEVHETKTHEVIENVKNQKSEIGILYLNDYNRNVLQKIFTEAGLVFHPLFDCKIYVYLWKGHPLANQSEISLEDLEEYPCLAFAQGENNSFYFAEEVLSTYQYKRFIRASDRATLLNLMVGLNGYTLCSGIICEELNGSDYCAIKLKSDEKMTIGYISRKDSTMSKIGATYIEEITKYKDKILD